MSSIFDLFAYKLVADVRTAALVTSWRSATYRQPPAPTQPQPYRVPAAGPPPDANAVFTILDKTGKEKGIGHMYPEAKLRSIVAELAKGALCNRLRLKKEVSHDLVKLALFDIVFFLDDSAPCALMRLASRS
jgi:hypothetical protein